MTTKHMLRATQAAALVPDRQHTLQPGNTYLFGAELVRPVRELVHLGIVPDADCLVVRWVNYDRAKNLVQVELTNVGKAAKRVAVCITLIFDGTTTEFPLVLCPPSTAAGVS